MYGIKSLSVPSRSRFELPGWDTIYDGRNDAACPTWFQGPDSATGSREPSHRIRLVLPQTY